MNSLIGPLMERIVIQNALAGLEQHHDDMKIAAEWNYRIWRASGKPIVAVLPEFLEQRQPRWPTPDWAINEVWWYALGIVSAAVGAILALIFCLTPWR